MLAPNMNRSAAARLDFWGLGAAVILGTVGALTIMIVPGFVMLVLSLIHI